MMKAAALLLCGLTAILVSPIDNGPIVDGTTAQSGQFSYQVSMKIQKSHFCGKSIINENTILTAAHWVFGRLINDMTVVVETNKLNAKGLVHRVASFRLHHYYNKTIGWYDIAIVKLQSNIHFRKDVQPVELRSTKQSHPHSQRLGSNLLPWEHPQ